jgi:hypothetical protein
MEILTLLWIVFSLAVKTVVYITYFFPMVGARILEYFNLWPTLWPFGPHFFGFF